MARAADGRAIGRLRTTLCADLDTLPTPPLALIARVAGLPDPALFKADGLRSYTELADALARHRPLSGVERLLDWGCGCGRISSHFLKLRPVPYLFGCDIDGEAIAWCQRELPGASFTRIDPEPPMPYEDGQFDAVIGYSVFTHLDRPRQRAWLIELARVLAPGGLLKAACRTTRTSWWPAGAERHTLAPTVPTAIRAVAYDNHRTEGIPVGVAAKPFRVTRSRLRALPRRKGLPAELLVREERDGRD